MSSSFNKSDSPLGDIKFDAFDPKHAEPTCNHILKHTSQTMPMLFKVLINNKIDVALMEKEPTEDRANNVAILGGELVKDESGNAITEDRTISTARASLIQATMIRHSVNEEAAVELIWPRDDKKNRDSYAQVYYSRAEQLMSMVPFSMTNESIRNKMESDEVLVDCRNRADLLSWWRRFQDLFIVYAGNLDIHRQNAEQDLASYKQDELELVDFLKAFKQKWKTCIKCKSLWDNYRYVHLLFQNLNQGEKKFFQFYRHFLDKNHFLSSFGSKPLSESIRYIEEYNLEVLKNLEESEPKRSRVDFNAKPKMIMYTTDDSSNSSKRKSSLEANRDQLEKRRKEGRWGDSLYKSDTDSKNTVKTHHQETGSKSASVKTSHPKSRTTSTLPPKEARTAGCSGEVCRNWLKGKCPFRDDLCWNIHKKEAQKPVDGQH